ncbi:MAG TPA: glycosyltransferase, partial [Acidimicrobiales bacterium]
MTSEHRSPRQVVRQRRNAAAGTPNADGSPLEGYVEHPAEGGEIERTGVMSGWHAWHRAPVAAVTVEMGGRIVGRSATSAEPRDDVAHDRGDESYAATGWVVPLDLRAVQGTSAVLTVTVYPSVDHLGVRLDPVTVTLIGRPTIDANGAPIPPPDEVVGNIDVPAAGARVKRGPITLKGWARSTYTPIARVELFANDVPLGPARLGIDRADVAANDLSPVAPVCGFEQLLDLGVLDPAVRTVSLRASVVSLSGVTADFVTLLEVDGDATPVTPRPAEALAPRAPGSPSALNLLVVTHDLGYGGAQLWLAELLRRCGAGSAFACTVVTFRGGALVDELAALGVEVHVTSPLPVDDATAYEGRLAELDSWLAPRGHTAALVNTFRSFGGADLAVRRGLPVVWAIHESWPESLIWAFDHPGVHVDPTIRALASRALAHAGAVIFEAEATRTLYEDRAPRRTVVVPYGVDTAALDAFAATTGKLAARRTLGLAEDGRVLLVMGTVEPRKGQTLLAEAFAELASAHPDATLVFVGDLDTA